VLLKPNLRRKYMVRRLVSLLLVIGVFVGVSAAIAAGIGFVSSQVNSWLHPAPQNRHMTPTQQAR